MTRKNTSLTFKFWCESSDENPMLNFASFMNESPSRMVLDPALLPNGRQILAGVFRSASVDDLESVAFTAVIDLRNEAGRHSKMLECGFKKIETDRVEYTVTEHWTGRRSRSDQEKQNADRHDQRA